MVLHAVGHLAQAQVVEPQGAYEFMTVKALGNVMHIACRTGKFRIKFFPAQTGSLGQGSRNMTHGRGMGNAPFGNVHAAQEPLGFPRREP